MSPLTIQLNFFLGLGTLAAHVAIAILLLSMAYQYATGIRILFLETIGKYAMHLIFLVTLFGVGMSLFYSEILGFVPCGLCWLQRVFLFPQALIVGMALYKRASHTIGDYLIALSIGGVIIGLYQHYLQMGGNDFLPCPASGGDCGQRIMFEFDYITFPLMSATFFMLVIVLCVIQKQIQSKRDTLGHPMS